MKNEKIKVEIEKQTYRLEEMSESMQLSIDNAKSVVKEQMLLIDTLNKSEQADNFAELIEKCKHQAIDIETQIKVLTFRKQLLDIVIDECKANEKIEEVVSTLLDALAVFNKHTENEQTN